MDNDTKAGIMRLVKLLVSKLGTRNMSRDPFSVFCIVNMDSKSAFNRIERNLYYGFTSIFDNEAVRLSAKKVPLEGNFGGQLMTYAAKYATDEADEQGKIIVCNVTCVETNNAEYQTTVTITFDYI